MKTPKLQLCQLAEVNSVAQDKATRGELTKLWVPQCQIKKGILLGMSREKYQNKYTGSFNKRRFHFLLKNNNAN